jgi:hypothetical protein
MPTYLCHGFRWLRRSIRVYVVVQNLEDASPEWVIKDASAAAILRSFGGLFDFVPATDLLDGGPLPLPSPLRGKTANGAEGAGGPGGAQRGGSRTRSASTVSVDKPVPPLPGPPAAAAAAAAGLATETQKIPDDLRPQVGSAVKLLEEFDPSDLSVVSAPYAYVADYVARVDLSVDVGEHMARYEAAAGGDRGVGMGPMAHPQHWLETLRDKLEAEAEVRWYVVVNSDEVREYPDEMETRPAVPSKTTPVPFTSPQPQPQPQPRAVSVGATTPTGAETRAETRAAAARKKSEADHHAPHAMQQQDMFQQGDGMQQQGQPNADQTAAQASAAPPPAPAEGARPSASALPASASTPAEDYHRYLQRLQGLKQVAQSPAAPAVPEKDGAERDGARPTPSSRGPAGFKRLFVRKKSGSDAMPG